MTPAPERQTSLNAPPSLYSSWASRQAMPSLALAIGGGVPGRQAELLLGEPGEVRGEHDAAGMAGPVLDVEGGVVLRQVGVARIAEDRLDEVEVADQAAGSEEADFHRLLRADAGYLGTDDRPQEQRDEARVSARGDRR